MKLKKAEAKEKRLEHRVRSESVERLKPAKKVLREVKKKLGRDSLRDKLLMQLHDLRQQEKELDRKHRMMQKRKRQRMNMDRYTKYMTLRQLAWERQRQLERQKREYWRLKLLQRQHQM